MTAGRRARLARYGLWQLRDYLVDKGIATALVLLFAGSIDFLATRAMAADFPPSRLRLVLEQRFEGLLGTLVLLGVLFATNGMVSDDRKHGYYRFLFAKPVSVPRFYAQKFLVHGAGFLLVSALLVLAYDVAFAPFLPPGEAHPFLTARLLPTLALLYLALGGVGFLTSAAWRVDWLSFMTVYIVSNVLWDIYGRSAGWKGAAVRALPPVHKLGEVYAPLVRGEPLPTTALQWLVLYGLACFVLGVVVIRRRPLTTS